MLKKLARRIKKDNVNGAKVSILEELFYDFHRKRYQVYWMNLVRGLFFGVGSVIGATVVIALLVWLLNLFADIPGGIGQFVQNIVDSMDRSTRL